MDLFFHFDDVGITDHFDGVLSIVRAHSTNGRLLMTIVISIVKIMLINGATTDTTPERSFSTARRIKPWLHSPMT